jgi:predicted AAA+ superfamily ATPase
MRHFNTSGPCDPQKHYTLLREPLLRQGREKVDNGRYFTIFAPHQSGKTTYFQLLLQELKDAYTPIWVSFENQATSSTEIFYKDFGHQLQQELSKYALSWDETITTKTDLENFFEQIRTVKPLVLFIDEFEGVPESVLGELMHTFRRLYHRKEYSRL